MGTPTLYFTLKRDRDYTRELYITQKGNFLIFKLDPCLFNEKVRLFWNFPKPGSDFERALFQELQWFNDEATHPLAFYDRRTQKIELHQAGTFEFYYTTDGSSVLGNHNGHGYIVVQPYLVSESVTKPLPMTGICMQTYISKLLGPMETWRETLKVSIESGYNFLHLTPLQELGSSRSAYCLMSREQINTSFKCTWADVGNFVTTLNREHGIFTITDLVLNHTACETDWLLTHPEAGYNLDNAPHLRAAYLLDRLFYWFNIQVADGRWAAMGIPPVINENSQLETIRTVLTDLVKGITLHELYIADVEKSAVAFRTQLSEVLRNAGVIDSSHRGPAKLVPHPKYLRLGASVDFAAACEHLGVDFNHSSSDQHLQHEYVDYVTNKFRQLVNQLNEEMKSQINDHVHSGIHNYIENIRYRFIDGHGPRVGRVTVKSPLAWSYFIKLGQKQAANLTEDEEFTFDPVESKFIMAHNGWVMGDDPLRNFAESGCWVYLRRELIPWGDNIKLRFGNSYDDCPFLWDHFRKNAEDTARIFHGVRLDNCHSTPMPMAEYVLDAARKVRPDLVVVAELFTSSEEIDNYFVNRLGISLLIREAMSAWSTYELGRLVYRFGGEPVGAFFQGNERPFRTSLAPAIFADQTHDNESPLQRHNVANMLAVSAMTCVAYCGASSNRGYDELVPHHINVVTEERPYMKWTDGNDEFKIGSQTALIPAKRSLNKLHIWLSMNGFTETFVDQKSNDVITVTRHNPKTRESCVLIARTAFLSPNDEGVTRFELYETHDLPTVYFEGRVKSVLLEARVCHKPQIVRHCTRDDSVINGLAYYQCDIAENIDPEKSRFLNIYHSSEGKCHVVLNHFPPGSVAVLLTTQAEWTVSAIERLMINKQLVTADEEKLRGILKNISLADYNFVLYRCGEEDHVELGFGPYDVPRYGPFVYGGLQGLMSVLPTIRQNNDTGHAICDNLRDGDWLMDYVSGRLSKRSSLVQLSNFLSDQFAAVKKVPRFLVPAYFELVVSKVFNFIVEEILSRFDDKIRNGPSLVRLLSLATLQFCGSNPYDKELKLTIAAGLPHFATGFMRSWGRDTFIALSGCLFATGRFDDARIIILRFAANLQNGLIPNLLGDDGVAPRYNCRDAVWWWLYTIRRYCELTKSTALLSEVVIMEGRNGDKPGERRVLHSLIHEALEAHTLGTKFRERNAGPSIDSLMTSHGFDIEFGVDWNTGFVYGGNSSNCGTWMDKMGNSSQASNRGIPATPRDGSAVELVGLCYAAVSWFATLDKTIFPYDSLRRPTPLLPITMGDWCNLVKNNFDLWFYIPEANFIPPYVQERFVNRRNIYKDTVGSSQQWSDYQLRPNFAVALAVAPELPSDPEKAWAALDNLEKVLLGPIGVKTLDPTDYQYAPYYDPGENSSNFQTSGGFSYHQGPEWLWPFGPFACARLGLARRLQFKEGILDSIKKSLGSRFGNCLSQILATPWRSLPELTNANGEYCSASCPAQAWSVAYFLEAILSLSDAIHQETSA